MLGKIEGADGQDEDGQDVRLGGVGPSNWPAAASALSTGSEVRYFCACPPPSPHSTALKSCLIHHCRELPFLAEFSHSKHGSAVSLTQG